MNFDEIRGQKTGEIVDTIQNSKININLIKALFFKEFARKKKKNCKNGCIR